jgi:microcystin-dependent protein/ribosomal protein S19
MKSKLLFLSTLMLLAVVGSFAQISSTGMAIQGIARNANNTAITNATIGLTFTVYYGTTPVTVFTVSPDVITDAFGVFSYTLNLTEIDNNLIYDNQLYLKIQTSTGVIISDEKLNFVPYAVSARNGVPTGSIMPFIGTTAPKGWALCDGQALTSITPVPSVLIAMLGSNYAPDLRGMFIRGAGTNSNSSYSTNVGPDLKVIQADSLESHLHEKGTLTTSQNTTLGNLPNSTTPWEFTQITSPSGPNTYYLPRAGSNGSANPPPTINNVDGIHTHSITGSTAATGAKETRPVNYGVNYIIKL